jgi:hypothetical protein
MSRIIMQPRPTIPPELPEKATATESAIASAAPPAIKYFAMAVNAKPPATRRLDRHVDA